MSLYERRIEEQIDRLLPTNDYINALAKAILKNDNETKEYLIQKFREDNAKEQEMIYRDFQMDIHGNLLFNADVDKINSNIIKDAETTPTDERETEFSKSS